MCYGNVNDPIQETLRLPNIPTPPFEFKPLLQDYGSPLILLTWVKQVGRYFAIICKKSVG